MIYDYIIVGSGLAGLNCALEASKKGSVLVVTKAKLDDSSSWVAQGGIAAVLSQNDSFKKHIEDTIKVGGGANDRKTVEFIVKHAPQAIKRLTRLGVKFAKNRMGQYELKLEGGHSARRIAHIGDFTGREIKENLDKKVAAEKNITLLERVFAADLLVKKDVCFGVRAIKGGKFINYFGKKTIIAAGGAGQVYKKTTNPRIATGDGIAMAARAGVKIKGMEFIQFHPTALDFNLSPLFLLSETLRGDGAHLINKKSERFMVGAHKLAELAPRDILSRKIAEEEKSGQIYLDLRHIKLAYLKKKYPKIIARLSGLKINPAKDLIPVTSAAHYTCGGIETNIKGETSVKNLYAFGESAHTGLHGANRLASNSLLEALVMSEQIIYSDLPVTGLPPPFFPLPLYKKQKSTLPIRRKIQQIMWEKAGITRSAEELRKGLNELKKLKVSFPALSDKQTMETFNILQTALLITSAAIKRKKSLGTHFIQSRLKP
jgi:L-aspartate oxidase